MKTIDIYDIIQNVSSQFRNSLFIETKLVSPKLKDEITHNVTNYEVLQINNNIYESVK